MGTCRTQLIVDVAEDDGFGIMPAHQTTDAVFHHLPVRDGLLHGLRRVGAAEQLLRQKIGDTTGLGGPPLCGPAALVAGGAGAISFARVRL